MEVAQWLKPTKSPVIMGKIMDFESIYREFQPRIYRYLSRLSGESEALDLTQAVFLKISRSLDDFRGESSLATWIYRIATNAARDHADLSSTRKAKSELSIEDVDLTGPLPDSNQPDLEQKIIIDEMNTCIRNVIEQLPGNYRSVLLLSEFDGFTNPEIADILGINVGTVKIRLHRARLHLRKAMECKCNFYYDERNELMCDKKPSE
jgi:RNA polymerase sigma-70 factor (ECF subfamily)